MGWVFRTTVNVAELPVLLVFPIGVPVTTPTVPLGVMVSFTLRLEVSSMTVKDSD